MPSFTHEIEFEVYCGTCGAGLCNQTTTDDHAGYRDSARVTVDVCSRCIESAKSDTAEETEGRVWEEANNIIAALEEKIAQLEQQV